MRKLLLIKYAGEIFLKGLNRGAFERKLRKNIESALEGIDYEFINDQGRTFLFSENLSEAIERTKKVFGVQEICVVTETEINLEDIKTQALEQIKESKTTTFKIETNRANKSFEKNSMEVSTEIGAFILKNLDGIKVDVVKPQLTLNIEIREKAYVYSEKIKTFGGLPYGMNGSTMLMLSGGIDSPVAGFMMAKRGVEVSCVYYHSHPYTSERAKDKVKELAKILKNYTGNIKLYIVPFTEIQLKIMEKCREDELTIIMRRFMMRIACKLAEKNNIQSVTTGESIGQVASQTMEGIIVSEDVATMPVFRPLISMDKIDIMDIARKIGTYETSILPYEDCCTVFVPKHPKTKPRLEYIIKSESNLEVESLVKEAMDSIEIIEL